MLRSLEAVYEVGVLYSMSYHLRKQLEKVRDPSNTLYSTLLATGCTEHRIYQEGDFPAMFSMKSISSA